MFIRISAVYVRKVALKSVGNSVFNMTLLMQILNTLPYIISFYAN